MSERWDPDSICREEDCPIVGVHAKHLVRKPSRVQVHRRPDRTKVQLDPDAPKPKPVWQRDDPSGLTGAVARATSRTLPTHFAAILRDVRDDYGSVSERSVYRRMAQLVARGHIVKVDVEGLGCAAYLRPKSRLLKDPEAIREYMLGVVEFNPTTKRARF